MEKVICPLKQRFSETQNPHCGTMQIREYYMGDCDKKECAWWIHQASCCAIVRIVFEMQDLSVSFRH